MKKTNFYLLALCFMFSVLSLNAQIQKQLPSSDFETGWVSKNGANGEYLEFQTEYFYTLNSLFALDNQQGPADITAYRDVNAQQGNFCIKLKSGYIAVGEENIFLPGMVGTITEEFVNKFINEGGNVPIYRDWFDCATPHAMTGWYKYNPVGGDSALIAIGFYRGGGDPVFVEQKIIKATTNNWTRFTIWTPQQYWDQEFTEIQVLFVASAGVNFKQLMECKGELGSTLWIDNVYLNYTCDSVGIKQNLLSSLSATAYPNPATDVLNIELNENFAGKVMVYNFAGSLIKEETIYGTECQLNTSSFSAGNYIYKIMNGNTIFAQGKFVVTK
jgi:hypothetical protein